MANRYIRMGATFNGDGTSPDLATSNGGVGAWNHGTATTTGDGNWTGIPYFEGATPAYGTLPAGTDVYVRTKDEAGNDITITLTANKTFGSTAATEAAPISWYFDEGDVWPGVQGVVTYISTSHSFSNTGVDFNNYYTDNHNLVFYLSVGNVNSAYNIVTFKKCLTRRIKFDLSVANTSAAGYPAVNFQGSSAHEDLWVISASRIAAVGVLRAGQVATTVTLTNPKIELLTSTKQGPVFYPTVSSSSCGFSVFGGEIYGQAATSGVSVVYFGNPGGRFDSFGLKFPQTMDFAPLTSFPANTMAAIATATSCDGKFGNAYAGYFCALTARYDGYYPTLNASLPDSTGTPWSYALYPYRTSGMNPARVAMAKTYTQDPAIKTVTVNLLWPNAMAAPTSDQVWLAVMYYDATTGKMVSLTTKTKTATELATNSALWSASTYGPTNFSKRQISIDTPTSIAKDTDVTVLLWSTPAAGSTSDIIIICPDVLLT